VALARARDGVPQEGLVSASRHALNLPLGCDGVFPLEWGVSETGPVVLAGPGWKLGKGTALLRSEESNG
jgi:hypothetical protein